MNKLLPLDTDGKSIWLIIVEELEDDYNRLVRKRNPVSLMTNDTIVDGQEKRQEVEEEPEDSEQIQDEDEIYEVKRIMEVKWSSKDNKPMISYKVRWKGYTAKDDTWELNCNLNCASLIAEFWERPQNSRKKRKYGLR